MDRAAFDAVAQVERRHWFFVARRRIIRALLQQYFQSRSDRWILDIGTGTGATTSLLQPYGRVVGIEYSSEAFPFLRELVCQIGALVQAGATELPFADCSFDIVTAFDVMEHIVDDKAAAAEVSRVLRHGGTFVCLTPAHPWLWSDFDEYSHHKRRYTATRLRRLLTKVNLDIERMFYINSFLFAPIGIMRIMRNVIGKFRTHLAPRIDQRPRGAGLDMPPPLINLILSHIFGIEARLAPHFDIPLGVTLVCIAKKD